MEWHGENNSIHFVVLWRHQYVKVRAIFINKNFVCVILHCYHICRPLTLSLQNYTLTTNINMLLFIYLHTCQFIYIYIYVLASIIIIIRVKVRKQRSESKTLKTKTKPTATHWANRLWQSSFRLMIINVYVIELFHWNNGYKMPHVTLCFYIDIDITHFRTVCVHESLSVCA